MKVLLVSASTLTVPYPVYPLGLDYVAHALSASAGRRIKIADMNEVGDYASLEKMIRGFSPDIIGLSLRNIDNTDMNDPRAFINRYRALAEAIRRCSDVPLVLGGSGFTLFPAEIMNILNADYGIIGEGERLNLLLNALEKQEDISAVPGLITRKTETETPPPLAGSFAGNFDRENAHVQFYLENGGMLNLQTKRGCHFKCIYCTYPHIEGEKLRFIPPEEVADAALRLQEAGAKYIYITDSVFNSDYPHTLEVARAFENAGISVPWGAFFAPTLPPRDYYKIMASAGLAHVEFGTDSLSDRMLASYKKPFRTDQIFEAHRQAKEAGLHIAHYLLPGGPGENCDSLNETLLNIDKLDKSVLFIFSGIRIYPHTELYDIAVKEGQISESQSMLEPVFYQAESITQEEIIRRVTGYAKGHTNRIVGAGGNRTGDILSRMYKSGYHGPLWEYLIQ